MPEKKFVKSSFVFTRKPDSDATIKSADGVCLLLKNGGAGTNFEREGRALAAVLKSIFPRQTLAFLKIRLSVS
jgi:hypothetical protein